MGFLADRFPVDISFDAEGGPEYRTDVVETEGGHEFRNQAWSQGRCAFDVAHAARTEEKAKTLLAFFRQARGRTHSFRYKDWADYQVISGEGVFVQLTATTFQMYKRYGSGTYKEDRKITRPVSGTVTVTGGSGVSIDYDTGIVTVTSGTPTSWTGEFDIPCRFDIDRLRQTIIDKSGNTFVIGWQQVPILEVRE